MGIFTKAVKNIVENQTSKIKPSKDINPLVKQTEDIFKSPDQVGDPMFDSELSLLSDTNQKVIDEEKLGFEKEEIVGRLYSPVYSAIENMAIGKGGTKGENISAYLKKRAPNVDKTELESFDIVLDPKRLYTKEEVLDLAKEKGSTDYTIEKLRFPEYRDSQRQGVMDVEEDYIELTVEGKQKYTESSSAVHLGRKSNVGHSRSSIRRESLKDGPLTQKIADRPSYLLIEEIQSDVAKRRGEDGYLTGIEYNPDEADYDRVIGSFEDESMMAGINYNVDTNPNVEEIIRIELTNNFSPYNVNNVDDIKIINEDETYIGLFKDRIEKQTDKRPEGNTLIKSARNALIDSSDFSRAKVDDTLVNAQGSADPEGQFVDDIDRLFNGLSEKLVNVYSAQKENTRSIQKIPVDSRSGYVRKLILANIAYAKRNGIDKIVIPNPREIAKQRLESFDSILGYDQQLFKAYEKASKKKNFNKDEFATDYFEKIFNPLYKDAVTKVLNTLKSETKGKIKYGTKELKYRGPYKEDAQGRLTNTRLPYKASAIEIDITDFEFNPEAQSLRFNEGGVVPMQEQMRLFNEGGLEDEGGSVDPVSGNDVPVGSTQEEVRDDIPAMLSEGEFVFPADVVRFVGLEKLMQLRQEAKMGLKQMEAMGQMGNSEEATMPDDMPFSMADLIIVGGEGEEPREMAQGGVVHMNDGGYLPKFVDQGVETAPINIENFDTTLPDADFSNVKKYVNKEGKVRFIPFGPDGKPLYPIPVGFFPENELPEDTPTETEEAIPTTPTGGGGGGSRSRPSPFQEAGSWNMNTTTEAGMQMWIDEATKISTFGNMGTGIVAAINPMLGAAFAGFNKMQKNKVISMLDDKIGSAQSQAQIDSLNKIKTRLTTKEGKGIISQAISGFIKPIAEALGIGEKEEKVIEEVSKSEAVADPIVETEEETQQRYESTLAQIQRSASLEDPSVDRSGAKTGFTPRVGLTPRDVETDTLTEKQKNLFKNLEGSAGFFQRDAVGTVPKAEEVTGGLGEVKTRREDIVDETLTPEVQSNSVRDEGLQNSRTGYRGYDQIKEGILNPLADALTINERGTTNAYESLMNFISQYTSDDPELSNLITQKIRSVDTEDLGFSGTINALGTGSLPTEGDIEKYLSSVSDDKPKKDTSAKDRKDRKDYQKTLRDAGTKAQKDVDRYKSSDAGKKATSTASGKAAMDRTESAVRDMQRGVTRGFAKGGLASRRK